MTYTCAFKFYSKLRLVAGIVDSHFRRRLTNFEFAQIETVNHEISCVFLVQNVNRFNDS